MMGFNEAMRAGIKMLPKQVTGSYVLRDKKSGCAIGTAVSGSKGSIDCFYNAMVQAVIFKTFPEMKSLSLISCPESSCGAEAPLEAAIIHLNDFHEWSREAIAEWADPRPELHVSMPSEPVKERELVTVGRG